MQCFLPFYTYLHIAPPEGHKSFTVLSNSISEGEIFLWGHAPDPPRSDMLCMQLCFAYYEFVFLNQAPSFDCKVTVPPPFKILDLPLEMVKLLPLTCKWFRLKTEDVATDYQIS